MYPEQRVGADPHLVPHHLWIQWERELDDKILKLIKVNNNLIDLVWKDDRPEPIKVSVQVQEIFYAGQKWEDKVKELRERLHHHKCDAMIVTSLTEIAYLLNIRGRDLPFTPVVKVSEMCGKVTLKSINKLPLKFMQSYLIVSHHDVFLYVDYHKMTFDVKVHLHADCYNSFCVK